MAKSEHPELRLENAEGVRHALALVRNSPGSSLKENLLRCYLLNLMISKHLPAEHPVKQQLIKLSVYLELLEKSKRVQNASGSNILKEQPEEPAEQPQEERKRRKANYVIAHNKVHTEKRTKKREERNPRIKNKRRYQDAHDLAENVRKAYPHPQSLTK